MLQADASSSVSARKGGRLGFAVGATANFPPGEIEYARLLTRGSTSSTIKSSVQSLAPERHTSISHHYPTREQKGIPLSLNTAKLLKLPHSP